MKHYAPYIDNILPAFLWSELEDIEITIPFEHHQTIGPTSAVGYALQIKDALQEEDIEPIIITKNYDTNDTAWTENIVSFTVPDDKKSTLKKGRYYKLSISYVDATNDNEQGYWSNTGIAKCTQIATPTINITGDFRGSINFSYPDSVDITEKLYSVEFDLYDANQILLEQSGEIIVNYQEQASIQNTIIEHQFNTYFDNTSFEEFLSNDTSNPFTNSDLILQYGIDLGYVEKIESDYYYLVWGAGTSVSLELIEDYDLSSSRSRYYQLCRDIYQDSPALFQNSLYSLKVTYTTINNYSNIIELNNVSLAMSSSNSEFVVKAEVDTNNALVNISFAGSTIGNIPPEEWEYITVSGEPVGNDNFEETLKDICDSFVLLRKNIYTGQAIRLFSAYSLESFLHKENGFQDLGVEQGVPYEYILIYNKLIEKRSRELQEDGSYAYKATSFYRNHYVKTTQVFVDFEDCYLYDSTGQLRLCFNPKVSSYKINIPQTKQETIGGKFPFVFENRQIRYKEFPISFLASYHSDPQGYFYKGLGDKYKTLKTILDKAWYDNLHTRFSKRQMQDLESPIDYDFMPKTNLDAGNIYTERQFKMAVLDWLTNGNVKIFKSPVEGNSVVKIINVSMAPEDKLGRMLHTFSGTAIEIEDYTDTYLQANNLLLYRTLSNKSIDGAKPARNVIYLEKQVYNDATTGLTYITHIYTPVSPANSVEQLDNVTYLHGKIVNKESDGE